MYDSGPPHNGHSASESEPPIDEITCQQFVELVTEYFEGALSARTLSRVEEHLVMCDWCATYVEQVQATIALLGGLTDERSPEPPDSVLATLRARRAGRT